MCKTTVWTAQLSIRFSWMEIKRAVASLMFPLWVSIQNKVGEMVPYDDHAEYYKTSPLNATSAQDKQDRSEGRAHHGKRACDTLLRMRGVLGEIFERAGGEWGCHAIFHFNSRFAKRHHRGEIARGQLEGGEEHLCLTVCARDLLMHGRVATAGSASPSQWRVSAWTRGTGGQQGATIISNVYKQTLAITVLIIFRAMSN